MNELASDRSTLPSGDSISFGLSFLHDYIIVITPNSGMRDWNENEGSLSRAPKEESGCAELEILEVTEGTGREPKEVNQPARASGAPTGISAHLRGSQKQALCVSSNGQRETQASRDLVVSSFHICIYTCSFRLQVTPGFQNHQDLFMVWAETQEIFQSYLKLEMSAIGNKARQVSDSELKHIIHKYKIMQMNTHTHTDLNLWFQRCAVPLSIHLEDLCTYSNSDSIHHTMFGSPFLEFPWENEDTG